MFLILHKHGKEVDVDMAEDALTLIFKYEGADFVSSIEEYKASSNVTMLIEISNCKVINPSQDPNVQERIQMRNQANRILACDCRS